jgi:hypothetical protein
MRIFYSFIKKEPLCLLGRWNIDYCVLKMNKKIDLSNEDHCGTCTLDKNIKTNIQHVNVNK